MTRLIWAFESMDPPVPAREQVLIWVLRMDGLAANKVLGSVRPTREDLADAAKAREEGGSARLFRRLLLRSLVARILGRHIDEIVVRRTSRGGLRVPDHALYASVSGSNAYAAIAVGHQRVGVDIEVLQAGAETLEDLRGWTAVEAFVKGLGTGFGADLSTLRLSPTEKGFAPMVGLRCQGEGGWLCAPAFVAAAVILDPA